MSTPISLSDFMTGTLDGGPVVALLPDPPFLPPPVSVVTHTINGNRARTQSAMFHEFTRAWDLPDHFGANRDAFDECARSLDDSPPADVPDPTGFLTIINRAHLFLAADDPAFEWFADSLDFYREHYRDHSDPPRGFGIAVHTLDRFRTGVRERWESAGVAVVEIARVVTAGP